MHGGRKLAPVKFHHDRDGDKEVLSSIDVPMT